MKKECIHARHSRVRVVIGGVLAAGEGGADPGPRGEEGGDGEDEGAHLQHPGHQQGYDQLHFSFTHSRR